MKQALWLFLTLALVMRAGAQSTAPVRLAIIAETDRASTANDLLTAELSKDTQVTLLERDQIDRVYREQSLSAANTDYLKLAQVLGADGLLVVRAAGARTVDLSVQLIAVKPGVLLTSEEFSNVDDISQWASELVAHLNPLLPKLSVLARDAVPISIVNLRAAMKSPETEELERQLTALTIERLTHERQLFVLERRKMQLLAGEKELKGLNDTAFWNGSYLLDGTIDRNGYSKDQITIDARLIPPKGGAPIAIEVSGSRTNLSEVIDQLAEKVRQGLKLAQTAAPWNTADEARKYFEEAKWALKWNALAQAQSAADSAWALGKQDMDCALVRVQAYERDVPKVNPLQLRSYSLLDQSKILDVRTPPTMDELDRAAHLLAIYDDFSRRLPANEPIKRSPWYMAGVDALDKASGVLRHFHFHPESQAEVAGKLAELRAQARTVAAWISKSPSVRDSYFLHGPISDPDGILRDFAPRSGADFGRPRNFFECALQWGCLWQERPEDDLALYRTLVTNSLFVYIEGDLWFRDESNPRLVSWNSEEQNQVTNLWQGFVGELESSPDRFLQIQAKALKFADALTVRNESEPIPGTLAWTNRETYRALTKLNVMQDQKIASSFTNLFTAVLADYDEIISNRPELFDFGWKFDELFNQGGAQTETLGRIESEYRDHYAPELGRLHHAEEQRRYDAARFAKQQEKEKADLAAFDREKRFLTDFTPYDFFAASKVFEYRDYTREQVMELQTLLTAYCSNMLATARPETKAKAQHDVQTIRFFLGHQLEDALRHPRADAISSIAPTAPHVARAPVTHVTVAPAVSEPDLTNVLVAKNFLRFPEEELPATNMAGGIIFGHRFRDGKLLLDLRYVDETWQEDTNGVNHRQHTDREAAGIWSPRDGWQIIPYPHSERSSPAGDMLMGSVGIYSAGGRGGPLFFEMIDQALYVSDRDAIRRYDFKRRQWKELPFPGQDRADLFAINHHLYAASSETIWEILDDGQSSRILASTRRQPPASSLDSRETLGRPVLFAGKDNSLRVALDGDVFSWNGSDWVSLATITHRTPMTVPGVPVGFFSGTGAAPEVFGSTAFFRPMATGDIREFWRLNAGQTNAVLCWREQRQAQPLMYRPPRPRPGATESTAEPLWKGPRNLLIGFSPMTIDGSNIYFLIDRSQLTNAGAQGYQALETRGRHADLVCLAAGIPEPLIVPIRFDVNSGPAPVSSKGPGGHAWMECSSNILFIGENHLPGVWTLPKAEIQAELNRQIASLPPRPSSPAAESPEHRKKALLARYDLDHNGEIDAEERAAAIKDSAFLEFEADNIDANHNGLLDVDELSYFDANKNRRLDADEADGVRAFQQILAAKALKEFDWDENGRLDVNEFSEFTRNKASSAALVTMHMVSSHSELERLQIYLERDTEDGIEQRLQRTLPGWNPRMFFGFRDPRRIDPTILSREINMFWSKQKAAL